MSSSPSPPSSNTEMNKTVKKRVLCGYGVDIDAVAGWLGSYGGEDSTSDISRGLLLKSITMLHSSSRHQAPNI